MRQKYLQGYANLLLWKPRLKLVSSFRERWNGRCFESERERKAKEWHDSPPYFGGYPYPPPVPHHTHPGGVMACPPLPCSIVISPSAPLRRSFKICFPPVQIAPNWRREAQEESSRGKIFAGFIAVGRIHASITQQKNNEHNKHCSSSLRWVTIEAGEEQWKKSPDLLQFVAYREWRKSTDLWHFVA